MKRGVIIVNPISGGHRRKNGVVSGLIGELEKANIESLVRYTTGRGDATQFAQEAARDCYDFVVAVGGDGTVHEVANGLVHTETALAIIPMGSGNGLARSLGVPVELKAAHRLVASGRVAAMDAGKVNDRHFFLLLGLGFDALVSSEFDKSKVRGPLPYFYLGVREFTHYKPTPLKLSFDSQTREVEPFIFVVANGQQYGNNAFIAPHAKLDDGLFEVGVIHHLTLSDMPEAMVRLFSGKIADFGKVEFYRTSELTIERQDEAPINVDGEPVKAPTRLFVSIEPKALKVIVPRKSPGLLA
jgi:YegS/Rv2252/BmrU family lipid kinase